MTKHYFKPLNGTSFDLLAETVGIRIATKLCKHFGGTDMPVAKSQESSSAKRIIKALGEVDAKAVLNACPIGDVIYIPSKPFSRKKRNQITLFYVQKRLNEGANSSQIAQELEVTKRSIRNYMQQIERNKQVETISSNSNAPLTHRASKNHISTSKPNKPAS